MPGFSHCAECGRPLHNAVFCSLCGSPTCSWACLDQHKDRHMAETSQSPVEPETSPDGTSSPAENPPAQDHKSSA